MTTLAPAALALLASASTTPALEAAVRDAVASCRCEVRLFAKNLGTGATFGLGADDPVRSASTIKLAVMIEAFDRVARGAARWDEPLTLTADAKVSGAGILPELAPGLRLTLRDAVHLMIVLSDNTATNLVVDRLGADAVNERMDALGFPGTRLLRKVMGGGDSRAGLLPENKRFGLGRTTPREMVTLLERLERGEIVSRDASAEMIGILKRQQHRDGVGRTLVGVEIANKTGALDRLRSDVAIVYSERGRIAMAITVDDLPEVVWNTENPGLLLLSRLSLALLDGLGAAAAPAPDRALLEKRLAAAESSKDWAAALPAARELDALAEADHAETLFRIARLNALLGRREEACAALETLSQAVLFDVGRIRKDEAFSALREDERFQKAVRAIWLRGYLWLLERPERDAYQKPDEVMAALAFRPGERVADIGAGSGYFARRVSKAVGPSGVVWAIDIAPEVLEHLEARARREGLANLRIQRVEADDPRLPEGGVDTILMVDTLHYVKDRAAYAQKLRAGLAPGGRVVVIDFVPKTLEERPWGPPPSQKMSREEVDAAMAEADLIPARVHDFLTEQFFVEYRSR